MNDVTEEVINYIDKNIRYGNWKVGDKIASENEICNILGVSRASARTGIRYFIGLNILKSVQGKGTYLINDNLDSRIINNSSTLTKDDFMDMKKVLEFRIAIESEAIYLATENIDESDIKKLEQTYQKMQENVGNQTEFVKADMEFHKIIALKSDNPFIINSMEILYDNNESEFKKFNDEFGYDDGLYFHRLIIDSLKDKDKKSSRKYLKDHLIQALLKIN